MCGNESIKILKEPSENFPFVVINKPKGLDSAPLREGEDCALTQAIELFPQIKNVTGKKTLEYGLVHRIDTATSGILLIATEQDAYNKLLEFQKEGKFIKTYRATVYNPENKNIKTVVRSRFRTFGPKGSMVKPVFEDGSTADLKKCSPKFYTTRIEISGNKAVCSIAEGYRHQVRAHLAYLGCPVVGDKLYNPHYAGEEFMLFEASKIEFTNPVTQKNVTISL